MPFPLNTMATSECHVVELLQVRAGNPTSYIMCCWTLTVWF